MAERENLALSIIHTYPQLGIYDNRPGLKSHVRTKIIIRFIEPIIIYFFQHGFFCNSSAGGSGHIADRLRNCRKGLKIRINTPPSVKNKKNKKPEVQEDLTDSSKLV